MAITKVTKQIIENVGAYKLLGNATASAASAQEVGAGSGMGFDTRGFYWKPNVVQAFKTDTQSIAASSLTAISGLSASITPTSSTSKVLVRVVVSYCTGSTTGNAYGIAYRGATPIGIGDAAGSRIRSSFPFLPSVNSGTDQAGSVSSWEYLDSPATTSSTTYSVSAATLTGTLHINRSSNDTDSTSFSRYTSSITLTEIPV